MYLVVPPGGSFPAMRRIELGPSALTIGRSEGCEIRVDVPGVDQEHAKISEVALIALGPDCAIGDVPLDAGSRRLVMPGDEIQIGSMIVALEGEDPSLARSDEMPTQRLGRPHIDGPRVRVVEGSNFGDELLLAQENREYLVGRGPKCDLIVDDREVSREHIKLMRRGYSVFVQDLSSTRGSWLGRAAVYTGATVEWTRPRMLRLGATVLSLELPDAIRRAAPGVQVSAPMTPPPRNRIHMPDAGPAAGPFTGGAPSARSEPPPRAAGASDVPLAQGGRSFQAFSHDTGAAAVKPMGSGAPMPSGPPPPPPPAAAASARGLGGLPPSSQARHAWKKTGPTIGKASGLLLLALAGLAILGALFVVFSLLE